MIKQCKGKDLGKVPKSKLDDLFYASIKYDGHYVQIHKVNDKVRFFTSGGKEFYIENVANELLDLYSDIDFVVETEYLNTSDGKLGSRGYSAKLTTYRTNFSKGIKTSALSNERFMVFDCLYYYNRTTKELMDVNGSLGQGFTFERRLEKLKELCKTYNYYYLRVADFTRLDLHSSKEMAKDKVKIGYEGLFLKTPDHIYKPGKRVNNAIKLKLRPTADLLCVGITEGEGKYKGMIGALVLQDASGRIVSVGSGLSDAYRSKASIAYLGKVIEIEYEQILDTYIQPTFVAVRLDKTKEEID